LRKNLHSKVTSPQQRVMKPTKFYRRFGSRDSID